jgi:hypothetical protein
MKVGMERDLARVCELGSGKLADCFVPTKIVGTRKDLCGGSPPGDSH